MSKPVPKFPTSGIYPWVKQYIQSLPTLHGKVALDIPCGDGRATAVLRESGADVIAYDLFPESFLLDGQAQFADLAERLPLPDDSIDIVVCQEGIEHLPNQLLALQEFHRVLKPGGTLVITTPNISNLVGRLANLVFESQLLRDTPYAAEESAWRMEHTGPAGPPKRGHTTATSSWRASNACARYIEWPVSLIFANCRHTRAPLPCCLVHFCFPSLFCSISNPCGEHDEDCGITPSSGRKKRSSEPTCLVRHCSIGISFGEPEKSFGRRRVSLTAQADSNQVPFLTD
ncbi:class I SAM-dependent methyltransferase [Achromobacter xylosoxidans]